MAKIYGYIYLTINHLNGHEYIGQHKWNRCDERLPIDVSPTLQEQFRLSKGFDYFPIDPNYIGSGVALLNAVKKYGKEHFCVVDVLDIAYSKDELDRLEIEWIAHFRKTGHILYNISDGGSGGAPPGKRHPAYGTKRTPEQRKHLSESHTGPKNYMYGRTTPDHVKQKISSKLSGKNNPMYGKRGPLHPSFGRPAKTRGRVQSPEERKMRSIAHMTKCPDIKPPDCTGMVVINNGEINKKIFPSELSNYPGWKRGMLRRKHIDGNK